jgi:hypothetical protein
MSPGLKCNSRRLTSLVAIAATSLPLGGCLDDLAFTDCRRESADLLHVGTDQTCKFRYGYGDSARYVVKVTKEPDYGQATGDGEFLRYVAKPGFVGEDQLTVKVERRGIGHVQWETHRVTVKVASKA